MRLLETHENGQKWSHETIFMNREKFYESFLKSSGTSPETDSFTIFKTSQRMSQHR